MAVLLADYDPRVSQSDIYIMVSVKSPIIYNSWEEGQYTSYAINVETNNPCFSMRKSSVRRRYSEFLLLHKMLKTQHPAIQPPPLPPRSLFKNRFSPEFIEQRRQGLETFLKKVFATSLYLSNKSVHLFVQSKLQMNDILSIVVGNTPYSDDTSDAGSVQRSHVPSYTKQDFDDNFSSANDESYNFDSQKYASHSHVTLGSRITLCTPTLHVPIVNTEEIDDTPEICSYTPPLSDIVSLTDNGSDLSAGSK